MNEVFNRKRELIKRDPVYNELLEMFKKVCEYEQRHIDLKIIEECENSKHRLREVEKTYNLDLKNAFKDHEKAFGLDKLEYKKLESYYITLDHSDEIRIKHQQEYPDHWKVFTLSAEIRSKWSVLQNFSFSKKEITMEPFINNEPVWVGRPPFETYTTYNASIHYPELKWLPYPNPFNKKPLLADINEFVTPGYNYSGRWIPIIINVSRLNNSDEKKIKKLVWEIVKTNLQKEEDKAPYDEYRELAFLYKIKENKFQRYLKWYDLHNEGLPFRTIAFYDKVEKGYPGRTEEAKEKLRVKGRTKTITTVKGQRVLSDVVGVSIKGEDAVEKAVKIIYCSIHRKPYPLKQKQTPYNCPEHIQDCPRNCNYLRNWRKDFDKRTWNPTPKKLTDMDLDANIIDNSKNVSRPIKSTIKRKDSREED